METPASISNSATAATLIQRAFRGAQKRIAAEQAELAHVLNALEEADEAFWRDLRQELRDDEFD